MLRDGLHDFPPAAVVIDCVNFPECLVHVRHRGDERRSFSYRATESLPVEGITPAVVLITRAASFLKYLQKVECATVVPLVVQAHRQKREAHGVMRVRDRESLAFPEKPSSRGYKGLAENDWSDRNSPKERLAIVERLGVPA